MKKHFTIRISGLVQGVFFRASTKEKADALNISGLVRNEPDGSVYVEAEGAGEDLKKFIDWCHRGPSRADVAECKIQEGALRNYEGFIINR
jgi:Acylphosphatases